MIVALLPVSMLEQTQSLVLKQRDSVFGACPCQSLLTSPQLFLLLNTVHFYSIFHFPVREVPCQGVHWCIPSLVAWLLALAQVSEAMEGAAESRAAGRGTMQQDAGMLLPMLPAGLQRNERQEQVCIWRRAVWKRGQKRESKTGETKFELPSSSVQSHSSTRQISLKCSSGLGSSVSSATNGVSSSASSC